MTLSRVFLSGRRELESSRTAAFANYAAEVFVTLIEVHFRAATDRNIKSRAWQ